jgi:hypothetical protein
MNWPTDIELIARFSVEASLQLLFGFKVARNSFSESGSPEPHMEAIQAALVHSNPKELVYLAYRWTDLKIYAVFQVSIV